MTAIEIARKMAALGQVADAQRAYILALHQGDGSDPAGELESALYLLRSGGDYKIAYTALQTLYARGHFKDEALDIMTQAFYAPNEKQMKTRYEKNRRLLAKYPYLFRKDFPAFEDLPIRFYPFDDNGYLPFTIEGGTFAPYFAPKEQRISRNFFHDLDDPILAADVFSQYELEYLNDNVRKSEWVARDNHIYLHYADWGTFCAHLQILNLRPLLEDKKFVFLIGEEVEQYPIDFKERFGIDYSQYPVKPVGIREIHKLIWHTQLASHNGGDFFNEVFFGHPNLLAYESLFFDEVVEKMSSLKKTVDEAARRHRRVIFDGGSFTQSTVDELARLGDATLKDVFVGYFLSNQEINRFLDPNARIAPAIFFQPHFHDMECSIRPGEGGQATLTSRQYQAVRRSPLFQDFKYIKTFTPMRRPTTSYGATIKFMVRKAFSPPEGAEKKGSLRVKDAVANKVLNRSFMIDWQDRLYQDSVLVRFEDGKLNPKATFTALAAFLDLPYTESMTYCSGVDGVDPESLPGNDRGFDPAAVYRTYDEYANDAERTFLEFFLRDAYEYYGYGFQYYDGAPVDEARAIQWIDAFDTLDGWIGKADRAVAEHQLSQENIIPEDRARIAEAAVNAQLQAYRENRLKIAKVLLGGLRFVNEKGQPLRMMPKLELDPALLEQPLYH